MRTQLFMLHLMAALVCLPASGRAQTVTATSSALEQAAAPVREMSTDRPDTTESAYTVPKGMFQVEMSFFDYSRDLDRGAREEAWVFGQINFKAGLAEDVDLQVIFDTHTLARAAEPGAPTATRSGFGDVTLRLKKNLWGNDEGRTAFAVMPWVSMPTGTELSTGAWEGGLILPFACALNERFSLGLMAEVDFIHNADTGGYDVEYLHSATVGAALTERLGMYVELVGIARSATDYQGLFDTGLTFAVTDSLVFDAGVRIGLNRAAPELGVFSGVSFRF